LQEILNNILLYALHRHLNTLYGEESVFLRGGNIEMIRPYNFLIGI